MRKRGAKRVRMKKKINSKSLARTGVAYKRAERREQKKRKNKNKSIKEA